MTKRIYRSVWNKPDSSAPPRRYTDAQIEEMCRMRNEQQMTWAAIAAHFKDKPGAILRQATERGVVDLRPPKAKRRPDPKWNFHDQNLQLPAWQ